MQIIVPSLILSKMGCVRSIAASPIFPAFPLLHPDRFFPYCRFYGAKKGDEMSGGNKEASSFNTLSVVIRLRMRSTLMTLYRMEWVHYALSNGHLDKTRWQYWTNVE